MYISCYTDKIYQSVFLSDCENIVIEMLRTRSKKCSWTGILEFQIGFLGFYIQGQDSENPLTLKMLQHSAWRKFLALLSCSLTLKPSWFLKHLSESILEITSDCNGAQKPLLLSCSILFASRFFFSSRKEHFFCSSLGFTLVSALSTYQVQLITSSSSDHYKIGPRRKETLFLYIKIKLSVEFMYQFSIYKGYP